MRNLNPKGFSLVELLVVVAIIGIFISITEPMYSRYSAKAKQSEIKSNLAVLYMAESAFNAEWATYNSRFSVIGYAPTGTLRYQHGFSVDFNSLPSSYAGPTGAATDISTVGWCAQGVGPFVNECLVSTKPIAPGAIVGAPVTKASYLAIATADISAGEAPQDIWGIDQNGVITNFQTGLP